MRFTVLGASAVRPNPGGACAGYLLEAGEEAWLLDCGPGVLAELTRRRSVASLSGVVLSHAHPDHILDLVMVRQALEHAPGEARAGALPVWHEAETAPALARLAEAFSSDDEPFWTPSIDLRPLGMGDELALGPLRMRFAPTEHYLPCLAMRIEDPAGRVLVYGADSGPCQALVDLAEGADLLVLEATLPRRAGNEAQFGHLAAEEAGAIAARAGAKRLLLTHTFAAHDREAMRTRAEAVAGAPTELAEPGWAWSS